MTNTLTAPDISEGYPSKGPRIGPAWAETWAELARYPGEWRDGHELWDTIAPKYELSAETLRALMFRMCVAGYLERNAVQVITPKGKRTRTHFRIFGTRPPAAPKEA